jgi:anthranilate phosphoribosyltransferase
LNAAPAIIAGEKAADWPAAIAAAKAAIDSGAALSTLEALVKASYDS